LATGLVRICGALACTGAGLVRTCGGRCGVDVGVGLGRGCGGRAGAGAGVACSCGAGAAGFGATAGAAGFGALAGAAGIGFGAATGDAPIVMIELHFEQRKRDPGAGADPNSRGVLQDGHVV
jgi:hypothetical protein